MKVAKAMLILPFRPQEGMNAGSSYLEMAERANHRWRSIRDKSPFFGLHQLTRGDTVWQEGVSAAQHYQRFLAD